MLHDEFNGNYLLATHLVAVLSEIELKKIHPGCQAARSKADTDSVGISVIFKDKTMH
jgi:hypothetical protein